jgi:hypothetical protein
VLIVALSARFKTPRPAPRIRVFREQNLLNRYVTDAAAYNARKLRLLMQ